MRKPKLRELGEAIRSLLSAPYTSKFPKVLSAAPEGFRGRPRYHRDDCVGCGACAEVCPSGAIDVEDTVRGNDRGVRKFTHHYDMCCFCGQCEAACITEKGILLSKEYDLAGTDRRSMTDAAEKDLLFCEICHSPIACVDHIKWIARKIGILSYTNPTLYLTRHKEELKTIMKSSVRDSRPVTRFDQVRITCPSCRREILFKETW